MSGLAPIGPSAATYGAVSAAPAAGRYASAATPPPADRYTGAYGRYLNPIPIEYMADYPGAADRLRTFGVNNSEKLLSWGKTSFGRWVLSHMVSMFTSNQERAIIDAKVKEWTGRADLARVGADHHLGLLLWRAGIYDAWHLTSYRDPLSRFELYTKVALEALSLGIPAPNAGQLNQTIQHALQSPPLIRW